MSDALPLLAEELFDVEEALKELEARKEKLRAAILAELEQEALHAIKLPRGSVTVQEYHSYAGLKASAVLPLATQRGWVDEALRVNGRGLHKLAAPLADVAAALRSLGAEEHLTRSITVRRR